MLRRFCLTLFAVSAFLGVSASVPTPVERAAQLAALVSAHEDADHSFATNRQRLDYAHVLIFELESDFERVLTLLEPLYQQALVAESQPAPRPGAMPWLAEIEHTLAHARFYAGQPADAVEPLLQSALQHTSEHLGPNAPATLDVRGDLATYYGRTGRADLAEAGKRAVAEAFQAIDPDSDDTLTALTEWSVLLGRLGRWDQAEEILRDVIARRETLHGLDESQLTHPLNLISWVLYSTGRTEAAVPILTRIVEIRTQRLGPDAAGTLTARNNLAAALGRVGRLDEAERLVREDLDRTLATTHTTWHDVADYRYALGKLALRRGQAAQAVEAFSAAAESYRQPRADGWRDAESRDLDATLRQLTLALWAHDPTDSRTINIVASEWLGLLEAQFQLHLGYTSEADRLAFLAKERPFDIPATLGDGPLLARAVVRLQGLILDSLIEDAALAAATDDPATASLLDRYRQTLASPTPQPAVGPGTAFNLSQLDQLEKELTQRLGSSQLPRQALTAEPDAVLAALPADTALVNFVRYAMPNPNDPTALPEYYLALLGTRDRWQVVPLGPAQPLDDLVERYQLLTTVSGPASWATELRARVLDPVRAGLSANIATLCIVPDGALHRVNFATLPEADGQTFAIQHHRYLWLDSAREVLRPHVASPPLSAASSVRLIAAPHLQGRFAHLPPLPGAVREIEAVRQAWPAATVFVGNEATPTAALASPMPHILHFAAHGFWAPDDADHHAALLQAGIALAGPSGELTAAQIAVTDLRSTQLVVISACGSGQGAVLAGEGILGLRRALSRAGIRHALLSLWPLDDAVTGDLLGHFYTTLATGVSPVEAYEITLRAELPRLAAREGISTALRRAGALIMVGAP